MDLNLVFNMNNINFGRVFLYFMGKKGVNCLIYQKIGRMFFEWKYIGKVFFSFKKEGRMLGA